ncbi:MAG: MFS transporter [Bryobacterales bacterium]|nr:MFS transporter [Bryobacterales bacterium]
MFDAKVLRWAAVLVFVLSSTLNFLDRLTVAALAPVLMSELHITAQDFGLILAAFSLAYAACAPLAGWWIDRVGLNVGVTVAVGVWSLAGMATGLVNSFAGLLWMRGLLGAAESAGLPSSGKMAAVYLHPAERPLGAAINQSGLSAGGILAPVFAAWIAVQYGWRAVFYITGALGFVWIPLWLLVLRAAPRVPEPASERGRAGFELFKEPAIWALVAANLLSMVVYTLWTNWTTVYLVREHGLTIVEAARFAWLPPLASTLGGFLGGALCARVLRRGMEVADARLWVCRLSAFAMLVTALIPLTPTPLLAVLGIGASFFWSGCWSVNLYTLPVDVFGARNAAMGVGAITFAFGLMQTAVSPVIGWVVDRHGFQPVCISVCVLPLLAYVVLSRGVRSRVSLAAATA